MCFFLRLRLTHSQVVSELIKTFFEALYDHMIFLLRTPKYWATELISDYPSKTVWDPVLLLQFAMRWKEKACDLPDVFFEAMIGLVLLLVFLRTHTLAHLFFLRGANFKKICE